MKKILLLFIIYSVTNLVALAQSGKITGVITDRNSLEPIPFANIYLENTTQGTTSDFEGNFTIDNIKPGLYTLVTSVIGYENIILPELYIGSSKPVYVKLELKENIEELQGIEIRANPFKEVTQSPVSLRNINSIEIMRNPGGNRDISKVIQSFPGVASTVSFRNDIIIRGGAPNENRFYLDDIEVPNINHFATQGSSGGPVGMINVNFIRDVEFYAGAFPTNRNNALSSVMNFTQINGNKERLAGSFNIGSSDIGLTFDGPTGPNSTFVFSARRSYLQFLFKALKLPFLPTYNDFQYKHSFNIDDKNQFTIIGLGAIDDFKLNQDVNNNITDPNDLERNNYILGYLPINTQYNYTLGAKWEHFSDSKIHLFVASRSYLNNNSFKYKDNIETDANLLLDYNSSESENNLRYELSSEGPILNYSLGVNYQNAFYTNNTFRKQATGNTVNTIDFTSNLRFNKFGAFFQADKQFFANRLALSLGIRTDFNDYSSSMNNPLEQLSPRLSGSFAILPKLKFNFNLGRYFQLPAYTVLGYRNFNGELVNQTNDVKYIKSDHIVLGFETSPTEYSKVTVEGFYKRYSNYPFLLADSISLANLGGDFGIIGNEPASSISDGKTYGIEFLAQQKMAKSIYGILSVTLARSYFTDKNQEFIPSAWDNKQIVSITAGKRFNNDWEVGLKFRYQSGTPYTPFDLERTATKEIWDVTQQGVYDWDKLNTLRLSAFHGLDIRIDKKWFFNKWSLNTYLDIQNIYNNQIELQPYVTVEVDSNGLPVEDPNDPSKYLLKSINNVTGTVLPSIGVMIEF